MFPFTKRYALAALAVVALLGLQGTAGAQFVRKNAIVKAVEKTKEGIITLKVRKHNSYGGKSSVAGSGVIVDERGYAITNHHVIDSAEKITVSFSDKSACDARVVVEDPKHDLAILRLMTNKKLKSLTFGPGSDLMVGETVIAIGNPYGFSNSVSTGIISALEREIEMPSGETLTNLIQTNSAINPGNSGGPLVNINGELIGINVALRDGAQGIAFALNAETVKNVLVRHLSAEKISKISHGLTVAESVLEEGKDRQRVLVDRPGSAGSAAGLKKGDRITKVGNLPVFNRFDVERGFWGYKAGDKVHVTVLRNGSESVLKLAVAAEHRVVSAAATKR